MEQKKGKAGEQLKDNESPAFSFLLEALSTLNQPEPWAGSSWHTNASYHQAAPRNLFTSQEEKKPPLDGRSVNNSTAEQLTDNKISDFSSLPETPSELAQPEPLPGSSGFTDVSGHHRSRPHKPAPRKLSTFDVEKGARHARSVAWSACFEAHKAHEAREATLPSLSSYWTKSLQRDPFTSEEERGFLYVQRRRLAFSKRLTEVSDHQAAPRKLFTSEEEKSPLDGRSATYSGGEQLKDNELPDLSYLPEAPSELNQPEPLPGSSGFTDVSGRKRLQDYSAGLIGLITDDSVSEYGSPSSLNPPPPGFRVDSSLTYRTGGSLKQGACGLTVQSDLGSWDFLREEEDHQYSLRSPTTSAKNNTFTGTDSSPDTLLKSSSVKCAYAPPRLYIFPSFPVYTNTRPHPQPRVVPPPLAQQCSFIHHTGNKRGRLRLGKKKSRKRGIESTTDSSDYLLDQPPPGTLIEAGMTKKHSSAAGGTSGISQDDIRDMELHAAAGPSTLQLSTSSSEGYVCNFDKWSGSTFSALGACADQASTVCSEGSRTQDVYELCSEPGGDGDALLEMDVPVTAVNRSVTNTQPARSHLQIFSSDPRWSGRDSSSLPRSHSKPSLSQITSANTCTGAGSLPDMLLESSFEEFTPDADEHDESYRFQCSGPGRYQCSVTGLVFHMEGEGVLVYRTVPWSRRLLVQHHKRPAGPLFDIKCVQQSVCRLHLPHCEIRSTGGGDFLSVAHVTDEDVEFIGPHEITETHVIINITGFSAFGNIKDEDSPAVPVRALVLLFYRPPADLKSLLNVLLLPRNVVLRELLRFRKKLDGDEIYIETSPHCKLHPEQEYSLSTRPEDDSVLVQPTEAEFDCDNYDGYFPSYQVILKNILTDIKLLLRDTKSSHSVWEREVCLSSTGGRRSALNLPPHERLMDIRSSFVNSISGPVLKSLVDKLLEVTVMVDSERESADVMQNNSDKARFVIDTVRKKGEDASSKMIEFLCEADPFLCEHLGLI